MDLMGTSVGTGRGNGSEERSKDRNKDQLLKAIRPYSLERIVQRKLDQIMALMKPEDMDDIYATVLESVERPLIRIVLEKVNGNQCRAAKALGINRNTLRKKIHCLDISVK